MAGKKRGISPENLNKLKAHLEALPEVEPDIIPTRLAVAELKSQIREAMDKGHSIEQLVDMWNDYGSDIKGRTLAGYLRGTADSKRASRKKAPGGPNRASSRTPERHAENRTDGLTLDQPPARTQHRVTAEEPQAKDDTGGTDTGQVAAVATAHTEANENEMVDEAFAQMEATSLSESGDGHGG